MFYHWTRNKIDKLKPIKYEQNSYFKPSGLWFSKDFEWLEWCDGSGLGLGSGSRCYELEISFDKFIIIDTFEKLMEFKINYAFVNQWNFDCIDWNKVSEEYDGIYFDNYYLIKSMCERHQHLLMSLTWFYALDINSGCIFNIDCVKKITEIKK